MEGALFKVVDDLKNLNYYLLISDPVKPEHHELLLNRNLKISLIFIRYYILCLSYKK